ncbi:TPA: hypothetical protein L8R59_005150 [Klebsiella pneumoniae]|nr:hypothetical protein [Klebsiella pneumoniae]
MTITLQAVNELIQSLESAGELSIKETKVMALAKAYQQLAAENVALKDCVVNHAPAVERWNAWADPEDKIQNAPETPATDRIVAEAEARGVEKAIECIVQTITPNHETILKEFAQQLREGAK